MSTIEIVLSAANMGPDATEDDFDRWAAYVNDNLCDAMRLDPALVSVEQAAFTGAGAIAEDGVRGADDEQRAAALEENGVHLKPDMLDSLRAFAQKQRARFQGK